MKDNLIIIISGPTASGKTTTSIKLAQNLLEYNLDPVIVNFDSLIFYNELNIGTAKPSVEELASVPHELINICSAKNPMNASDYVILAKSKIEELHNKKKIVILTGGSGFYLRALIKGMYASSPTPPEIREQTDTLYAKEGITPFIDILKKEDHESYKTLHQNDHYRVIRAVEHFLNTGSPISIEKNKKDQDDPFDFTKNIAGNWNIFHCHLDLEKSIHCQIIEQRTREMVKKGLVEEVKNLLELGFTGEEKPLQSIGYKETIGLINGEFEDVNAYIERIVISTRQFAKAQRTWFKKVVNKNNYYPLNDQDKIVSDVLNFIDQS